LWLALTQAGQEPIGRSQRPRVTLKAVTPAPDAAYEAFITEHQRAILNYLWRMTNDEQCAYDLTQEVFVRAWRHFNKVAGYDNPRGWLFRVATNLALTELAGRKRHLTSVELLTPAQEPASSDPAWRVEQRDTVRAALVALAPRRRAALTLREVYGLSYAEIARALETSEASIRMTVSRAREQFRTLYLQAGGEGHDA
jgi:RNA polymerase sigma-70 factor (ECF subfamily)